MSLSSFFLHTVKWFQVLQNDSQNLTSVISLHAVCSIRPIYKNLSGATTPGQSGPGSNASEGILHINQFYKVGALPSDGLMSYQDTLWRGSYCSAEMQSVYSTVQANWAVCS